MFKLMTNSFMGTVGVRGQGKATGKAMVGWFGRGLQPKRKRASKGRRKRGKGEEGRRDGGTEGRREHGKAVRKKEI
jgi:hypothetical protein